MPDTVTLLTTVLLSNKVLAAPEPPLNTAAPFAAEALPIMVLLVTVRMPRLSSAAPSLIRAAF